MLVVIAGNRINEKNLTKPRSNTSPPIFYYYPFVPFQHNPAAGKICRDFKRAYVQTPYHRFQMALFGLGGRPAPTSAEKIAMYESEMVMQATLLEA
jgi:hypothetical protein